MLFGDVHNKAKPHTFALTFIILIASIDLSSESRPKRLDKNQIEKKRTERFHFIIADLEQLHAHSQHTFTCSKPTIEALVRDVK